VENITNACFVDLSSLIFCTTSENQAPKNASYWATGTPQFVGKSHPGAALHPMPAMQRPILHKKGVSFFGISPAPPDRRLRLSLGTLDQDRQKNVLSEGPLMSIPWAHLARASLPYDINLRTNR